MHDIYILGAGAMGCLWGSYFPQTHTLHYIQRQTTSDEWHFRVLPNMQDVAAKCTTAANIQQPIEHLIIATKAYDAEAAIRSVESKLATHANVILLQNGLGSQQAIANAYPQLSLFACSSTEGAYKQDTNTLVHAGKGTNSIGPMIPQAKKSQLIEWLPEANYQWYDDIEPVLWQKFMINCAINPLTMLYQCKNGELLKQPEYFKYMRVICEEIDLITQAKGIKTEKALNLAQHVCERTAQNLSSMLQDSQKGRKTELDYMTGYLIKQAKQLDIDCPMNAMLYHTLTTG